MSEIRFYNYEFEPITIEPDVISLYKTVYYNKIGIFEARVSPFSKAFLKILNEPYILAEEGGQLFVILAKQVEESCIIYGRTPNWFLSKRIEAPFTSKRLYEAGDIPQKNAEEIVRYLITKNFGEDDGNFLLGEKIGFNEEVDFRRIVLNPLSDIVIDCLDTCGAGHEVTYDKEKARWTFNILKGKELDIIVGEAQKNTLSSEYVDNALSFANCGVYEKSYEDMGEWDATANSPQLLEYSKDNFGKRYYVSNGGTRFGITFVKGEYAVYGREDGRISASDNASGYPCTILADENAKGLYKWFDSLTARTEETAKTELLNRKWIKNIEADTEGLKLGRDYNLGDIVRVQKKVGDSYLTYKKRIIGTETRAENGVRREKIIFGDI